MTSKSITTRKFKAQCLKVLDEVAQSGESLTITSDGRPVARLMPIPPQREVLILGEGDGRILKLLPSDWSAFLAAPKAAPDFMADIERLPVQERTF